VVCARVVTIQHASNCGTTVRPNPALGTADPPDICAFDRDARPERSQDLTYLMPSMYEIAGIVLTCIPHDCASSIVVSHEEGKCSG